MAEQRNAVAKGAIRVMFVKLSAPVDTVELVKETSLGEFLNRRQIEYGPSIRVNREVKPTDYILKNADIVTQVTKTDGGMTE